MIRAIPQNRLMMFWSAVAVGIFMVSWLVGTHGLIGASVTAALFFGVVAFFKPELLFVASIATIIVGQMIRLPVLGGDNSIVLNDILLPTLIITWLFRKMSSREWTIPRHSLTMPLWIWFSVMVGSILLNTAGYNQRELLSGALYIVRWLEYASLLWIAFDFCRTRERAGYYLRLFVWTGVVTAVLGFLQLYFFPDFSFMVPAGWDPHVGRLLSTWFDPNFLGGYLAFLITVSLAVALGQEFTAARWWWFAVSFMTIALILTFSRSGYVALAVGAGFVTIIRSRPAFFLGLAIFLATVMFIPRVQERVIGIRDLDVTAKLRLVSWNNAFDVIHDHPVIGVGYNLYRYVQVQYGFLEKTEEHSASGSDSSWLTAWVTTGFVGLVAYLWLFFAMLREAWKTWKKKSLPPAWRGFGLGLLAGLLALFVHSQFVNSFFYPHIMEVVWIFVAIAIVIRQPQQS